jgi:hypothetical protein
MTPLLGLGSHGVESYYQNNDDSMKQQSAQRYNNTPGEVINNILYPIELNDNSKKNSDVNSI